MSIIVTKQDRRVAYAKVFGGVNLSFSRSESAMREAGRTEIRVGKTARDKANGHIPYKKNRRILDASAPMLAGINRRERRYIKA